MLKKLLYGKVVLLWSRACKVLLLLPSDAFPPGTFLLVFTFGKSTQQSVALPKAIPERGLPAGFHDI
jgi:hypothetical protein